MVAAPITNGDATSQTINESVGDDAVFAGAGKDAVSGGVGKDMLLGCAGNDLLHGGPGVEIASGGAGDEGYTIEELCDVILQNAGEGNDNAFVFVDGWTAPAYVEQVYLQGGGLPLRLKRRASVAAMFGP